MGTQPTPAGADKPADSSGSYLSISSDLKTTLDQLERPDQPVLVTEVGDFRTVPLEELRKQALSAPHLPKGLNIPGFNPDMAANPAMVEMALGVVRKEIKVLGYSIDAFKEDRISASLAIVANSEEFAKQGDTMMKAALAQLPQLLTPQTGTQTPRPNQGTTTQPMDMQNPTITSNQLGSMLLIRARVNFPLNLPPPFPSLTYQMTMDGCKQVMVQARSASELLNRRPRIHELARATQAYLNAKGQFPQAASKREDNERLSDYPPSQRLSLFAELLPFLGDGDYQGVELNPNGSWREGPNLVVAQMALPQLQAEMPAGTLPRIHYPGLEAAVGPTHYVGVSGIGYDAAEYLADDPAVAKKLGIFGYNRITRKDDIKDGLDKTILLLQVPTHSKLPWLAGGGSTVRGISEDADCLQPFICCEREHDGKKERGARAIMADGKVRFIPASTPPEIFRALCTINGGEKIDNLDAIAPEIPPEASEAELKTDPSLVRWTEYTSTLGRYSVLLPSGKVQDGPDKGPLGELGEVTALVHSVTLDKGGAFGVVCFDLTPAVVSKGADAVYDAMKNALPQAGFGEGAKVVSEKKVQLGDLAGRDWTIDCPKNSSKARTYHFLVGNRLYQVAANGLTTPALQDDAQKFLESFRILAAAPATPAAVTPPPAGEQPKPATPMEAKPVTPMLQPPKARPVGGRPGGG
jgi:hypothetical protein